MLKELLKHPKALAIAIILHVLIVLLLIVSFNWKTTPKVPEQPTTVLMSEGIQDPATMPPSTANSQPDTPSTLPDRLQSLSDMPSGKLDTHGLIGRVSCLDGGARNGRRGEL